MRAHILLAGAALSLAACGGGETEANEAGNTLHAENLIVNDTIGADAANVGVTDPNALNMTDPNASNMMANDLTNNDTDTNLANGI